MNRLFLILGLLANFQITAQGQISYYDFNINRDLNNFDNSTISNRKLLKKMGLCRCVYYYSNSDVWRQDASISLLTEIGDYSAQGYYYMDSIARIFVKSMPYSELTNNKGMLLHCVEFYNSKKLDELVIYADKYLPNKNKTQQ